MDNISIEKLDNSHVEKLYVFEKENKAFFEKTCLPRLAIYDDIELLKLLVYQQVEEMKTGDDLMFVIMLDEELIGRINVTDFEEEAELMSACVGYRIAEQYNGNGYATEALSLMKEYLKKEDICQCLYAGTDINHIGSQIVLLKNGFRFLERVVNVNHDYGPGELYVEFDCYL